MSLSQIITSICLAYIPLKVLSVEVNDIHWKVAFSVYWYDWVKRKIEFLSVKESCKANPDRYKKHINPFDGEFYGMWIMCQFLKGRRLWNQKNNI